MTADLAISAAAAAVVFPTLGIAFIVTTWFTVMIWTRLPGIRRDARRAMVDRDAAKLMARREAGHGEVGGGNGVAR